MNHIPFWKSVGALGCISMLVGCSSFPSAGKSVSVRPNAQDSVQFSASSQLSIIDFSDSNAAVKAIQAGMSPSSAVGLHAIELIQVGDINTAGSVLNAALKLDISNAHLHYLNAVVYHLKFRNGDKESYPLARAGYLNALGIDQTFSDGFLQIGRLFLDNKEFAKAKQSFSELVDLEPENAGALYGLAHAALFEGDTQTVTYAMAKLRELNWESPLMSRLEATVLSIAGQDRAAQAKFLEYEQANADAGDVRFLKKRLPSLIRVGLTASQSSSSYNPVIVAELAADSADGSSSGSAVVDANAQVEPVEKGVWFRCDKAPGIPTQEDTKQPYDQDSSDETLILAPLPKPCAGEKPPVAMIEVTMIRTEVTESSSYGVNLLEGLSGIFKNTSVRTNTDGLMSTTRTREFGFADGSAADYLSYSLNIANAAQAKNEVIARPSLAVVDRVPSLFFSGANITLGYGTGTSSSVVDKPVGVSLAVTPTFVDDDSVLLAMRAARSFIEPGLASGSNVLLQQTRNVVSASALVKFGESFILTGLVEKELDSKSSEVPLLGDIPIIQFLFKKSEKLDFTRQILTLVTARRLVPSDEDAKNFKAGRAGAVIATHKLSEKIDEFLKLQTTRPVIDELLEVLPQDNRIYNRLVSRDVIQEKWSEKTNIRTILQHAADMINF